MANTESMAPEPASPRREDIVSRQFAAGGSFIEAIGGAVAAFLAILGLAGVLPVTFACLGTIVLGAALVLEGGAVATRLFVAIERGGAADVPGELMGGLGAESLAGVAAMVLGFLAFFSVVPYTLLDAAVVVIGAGLVFGSASTWRINFPRLMGVAKATTATNIAQEAVYAASGAHALVGLCSLVLGVLSLLGYSPVTLTLVALLAIGGAVLMSGVAIGGRFLASVERPAYSR
jgi:hypothetical protein